MNDKNQKTFQELFKEAIELRGLSLDRLAETTGVPKNYLENFISGDFKKLPPSPYVRGFLMKISAALGIDGNYLWGVYEEEIIPLVKNSDRLPVNRFVSSRKNGKKIILTGIVLIFISIYLFFRIDNLLGTPKIEIRQPAENGIVVNEQSIKLSGKAVNFFDKLTINDEEIFIKENGDFEKEYLLRPGGNKIEFKVKRFLGKEIKIEREIIYQPQ